MTLRNQSKERQPVIVKYVQTSRSGIQSQNLGRHTIGYINHGKRYVYYGDVRHEIPKGNLYFMSAGQYYVEDVPEEGHPFEQIVFYYSTDQIARIVSELDVSFGLELDNSHACSGCTDANHVIYPAWSVMRSFFTSVNGYLKEDAFSHDRAAETIKMIELVYLIVSREDCCIKTRLLDNIDMLRENFEQTIQNYVFTDISVEELARKCNRSLTSFKKEFKKHFYGSPHKWFIEQRLMHSRLLLISTGKSISEIGNECNFPNTSHFIKLFKKEYGLTPTNYRQKHRQERGASRPVLAQAPAKSLQVSLDGD